MKNLYGLLDGGFRSRKLLFALLAITLVFMGGILAAEYAGIAAIYSTMVTGIEVITGLYLAGNTAAKHVQSKVLTKTDTPEE